MNSPVAVERERERVSEGGRERERRRRGGEKRGERGGRGEGEVVSEGRR